jgi:hypothetical protein
LETQTSSVEAIALSAVVRKRTWLIIVHSVSMEDHPLDAWKKHVKRIEKENAKSVVNLRI